MRAHCDSQLGKVEQTSDNGGFPIISPDGRCLEDTQVDLNNYKTHPGSRLLLITLLTISSLHSITLENLLYELSYKL